MRNEQLFTGLASPAPAELSSVEFSRSPLENYVVEEMPADLQAVREDAMTYGELAAKQADIVRSHSMEIHLNDDPHQAKVTQLDLLFMLGSYLPTGEDAFRHTPPELFAALAQQHDRFGLTERMDYEMIIDLNTAEYERTSVIRVYSADTEYAKAERDFYIGHVYAEEHARQAAYGMHELIQQPDLLDTTNVLRSVSENTAQLARYMGAYRRLPTDAFASFRPYLASYPDGTRNASGAFMPSVQLMELALHEPTEGYTTFIDESMSYFPADARPVVQQWFEESARGQNLEAAIKGGDIQLSDEDRTLLSSTLKSLIGFRTSHFARTKEQIPEAFNGNEPTTRREFRTFGERPILDPVESKKGTGGFDVVNVLGSSVFRLMKLKERIEGGTDADNRI